MKKLLNIETSKKLLLINYLIGVSLIISIIIGTFIKIDVSSLIAVVNIVWIEIGASSVSYYMKSKAENKIKLINNLKKEIIKNIDITTLFN